MNELTDLFAAAIVGLLGGVHCVGMCGGILGALTFGLPAHIRASISSALTYQLAYNLGRITSYTLAGALAGGLGTLVAQVLPLYLAQRLLLVVACLFMVMLGLYLAGWWVGLNRIERLGSRLWSYLEPLARRLLPVRNPRQAWMLGLVWGWLPCGLVYSVLIWTISSGSAWHGATLMLSFGLGTLPNLMVLGFAAGSLGRWLHRPQVRRLAGAGVIILGLITLWRAW